MPFRGWALAHPGGLPARPRRPRARPPRTRGGAVPEAARRVRTGSAGLADAAWPYAEGLHADGAIDWSDFEGSLLDKARPAFPDLPPAGAASAPRIRSHLRGLVSLEVYGHLRSQTVRPDKRFDQELTALVRSLNVPTTN
ncbi:WHG domain-containing protein [Streptomyces lateritius]|uniref:WHG domain-containing protein n=1 Tax=Streptomyces lateritius TaxID=67313 RepID=A0ABW6YF23_9ACTN